MKKIFITLSLALIASMSLVSCSKGEYNSGDLQTGKNPFSDENNKPKIVPTGNFIAKINGSEFKANYANAYYTEAGTKLWVMLGYKTDLKSQDGIFLTTENNTKGVFNIDINSTSLNSASYTATGSTTTVLAESGTIEITEVTDTRVKGKFNFKAAGGVDVTDGEFDLPIIKYTDYYQLP